MLPRLPRSYVALASNKGSIKHWQYRMNALSNVGIFWDYENCALPSTGQVTYTMLHKMRRVALRYGSVKTFKAYLELSEQPTSKLMTIRSELQSCGVSLIDCPHVGRKDVVDKMMIVDMMAHALDNSAPSTIILLTGDRDFVYAVSTLCLRQYKVVLIAPKSSHDGLKAQADFVYNWPDDFLPPTLPATLVPSALASSQGVPRSRIALTEANEAPVEERNKTRVEKRKKAQVEEPEEGQDGDRDVPQKKYQSEDRMMDQVVHQEVEQQTEKQAEQLLPQAQAASTAAIHLPRKVCNAKSSPPFQSLEEHSPEASERAMSIDSQDQSAPAATTEASPPEARATATGTPKNKREIGTVAYMQLLQPSDHWDNALAVPPTPIEAEDGEIVQSGLATSMFSAPALTRPPGLEEPSQAWSLPWAVPSTSVASSVGTSSQYENAFLRAAQSGFSSLMPTPSVPQPTYQDEDEDDGIAWQTFARVAKKRPAQIPAEFKPLVKVLKRQFYQGTTRVESSQLGTLLSEEKTPASTVYERAGVSRLKEYTALAAEMGIVTLSKESANGHNWVTLNPVHRRKAA
ncbi:NYN domain-containing protein [Cubamyces lactineus]|nr:NYN domain-containing protein [Cubamyces lactineus]